MAKNQIIIDGVVVKFGSVLALDSFTVNIPKGIIGLLGPNGAGKSTLIKAMLGLVDMDAGVITIKGMDPRTDITSVRDMIGYMPENDCLILSMNAVELVSYMGMISGMKRSDSIQRAHEVLDFVGIGEERYRKINSYSTGMKQKVKLAQAIVHDPSILLLDEPTNGMDPQGREDMLALIKKIGSSGKTILVSSHILHEVEQVSEHVIIISNGRLIREGSMKSLMKGEKGYYRIRLLGSNQGIHGFLKELRKNYKVVSSTVENGQKVIIFKGDVVSSDVFAIASRKRVQLRYFGPDTLTLEDVFLKELSGGGRNGN